MRSVACAVVVGGLISTSCDQPPIPLDRASAAIAPFENASPTDYLCDETRRLEFARAASTYSAAKRAAEQPWPDLEGVGPPPDSAELAMVGGIYVLLLPKSTIPGPGDFRSPVGMATGAAAHGERPSGKTDTAALKVAAKDACPELVVYGMALATYQLEVARGRYGQQQASAAVKAGKPKQYVPRPDNSRLLARVGSAERALLSKLESIEAAHAPQAGATH